MSKNKTTSVPEHVISESYTPNKPEELEQIVELQDDDEDDDYDPDTDDGQAGQDETIRP
jgi:hypothetical protein